jgi:hypothetical protein
LWDRDQRHPVIFSPAHKQHPFSPGCEAGKNKLPLTKTTESTVHLFKIWKVADTKASKKE